MAKKLELDTEVPASLTLLAEEISLMDSHDIIWLTYRGKVVARIIVGA